jgi:predicted RNase H-like HicB family nuclease
MILFIAVEKPSRQKCPADINKRILLYQRKNLFIMEETYRFSAVIQKEGKRYVSWCPELDIASQGETIEEAIKNLKEATELYLEEDVQVPAASQVLTTTIEVSVG